MAQTPKYAVKDDVYFRTSAAIGYLEKIRVASVAQVTPGEWVYGVARVTAQPNALPTITDNINYVQNTQVFYRESELITYCEALPLARAYHASALAKIDMMMTNCP